MGTAASIATFGVFGSQDVQKLSSPKPKAPAAPTATPGVTAPTPNAFPGIPSYALPYVLSQFTQVPGSKVPGTLPSPTTTPTPAPKSIAPTGSSPMGGVVGGALSPLLNKTLR